MKQSQKQNVIININSEVKKTKKRRVYRKRNFKTEENPQNVAYNPNVLPKYGTTPSYGLKSVNPSFENTSVLTSLLLDKLKQPEPTEKQYSERMTPIKQEYITPKYKQEDITPKIEQTNLTKQFEQEHFTPQFKQEPNNSYDNITNHPIPRPNLFIPEESESRRPSFYSSLSNDDMREAINEEKQNKQKPPSSFYSYLLSPFQRNKSEDVDNEDTRNENVGNEEVINENTERDRGRPGNFDINSFTFNQARNRIRYLKKKEKENKLSEEEKNLLQKLRDEFL